MSAAAPDHHRPHAGTKGDGHGDSANVWQGFGRALRTPCEAGRVDAAVAKNLEVHMKALDLTDVNSKQEHDAYRDLPMGRHDQKAMSTPEILEAFEKFVKVEQELLALLQRRVEQDQRMLTEMGGARRRHKLGQ